LDAETGFLDSDVDGFGEYTWLQSCGAVLGGEGEFTEEREVDDPSTRGDGGPGAVAARLDDEWNVVFDGRVDLQCVCQYLE
jgi:hypothetical protein